MDAIKNINFVDKIFYVYVLETYVRICIICEVSGLSTDDDYVNDNDHTSQKIYDCIASLAFMSNEPKATSGIIRFLIISSSAHPFQFCATYNCQIIIFRSTCLKINFMINS